MMFYEILQASGFKTLKCNYNKNSITDFNSNGT